MSNPTIRDEMTAAGQAWALTSGEPSTSSGDVAVVREVLQIFDGLQSTKVRIEQALSALARVQESERNVRDNARHWRLEYFARDNALDLARDELSRAIHARDRAIDQKHRAILERNNLRTELAALKEDLRFGDADAEDAEPTQASLTERDLELLRHVGLALGEDSWLGKPIVALTLKHERLNACCSPAPEPCGDLMDVVFSMRQTEERYAEKYSAVPRENVRAWASTIEAHQCGGEREADGDDWAKRAMKEIIPMFSEAWEPERWDDIPAMVKETIADLSASQARVAELEAEIVQLKHAALVQSKINLQDCRRADVLQGELARLRSREAEELGGIEGLANELEACHGIWDEEDFKTFAEHLRAQGAKYERLVHDHIERCRFFLRDGYEYDKSDPAAAWEPLMIIYSAARTYHERMVSEPAFAAPQGSREAVELADDMDRCGVNAITGKWNISVPMDTWKAFVSRVRAMGAAPQGEAGTSAIGMCPLCAGPPYVQQQSDGHIGCSNHACKLVGARITREAWGELSRKVYLDPEHQGGQG